MKPPQGPKTPPVLQMIRLMSDPLGYLEATSKLYGDIFTLSLIVDTPTVFVSHPEGIKEIYTNKNIAAPGELNRNAAHTSGEKGILQLDGLKHKNRRQIMLPAFHGTRIQAYGQRIYDLTDEVMSKQTIGKPFSAYNTMEILTLKVILEAVLGLHEGEQYEKIEKELDSLLNSTQYPFWELSVSIPFLRRDFGSWSPWGYFLRIKQRLQQLLYAEIDKCRQQQDFSSNNLLSLLVSAKDEANEPLSNEEIHDLMLAPLFAGRDATTAAISWSLYWTHHLPAVREKLLQELNSLGESPDIMSIVRLPYLSAVCNEALRLYPTQVFTFPRRVESTIELMGYELSPGTVVIGNIYLTHQREDLYPDAKQFRPERFLEKQFSPYEFFPFGVGERYCMGATLVIFEMKLVLAKIILGYQLELATQKPERPKRNGINFLPASGLKMVLLGQRSGTTSNSLPIQLATNVNH
ncbi:MAG: cytochrome P450 [Nostoc sp.]|uniref:cytochrome P450 n=1 Tax=Nostoc sp. TaxID=1180 RepID=UPI002FF62131